MYARSSQTHPLRIDTVRVAQLGPLGLTFCPGKKQIDAASGPWLRDLDADLDRIAEAGFAAVIGLMEEDEYGALQVPLAAMRSGLRSRGIEFHHAPIRDVSVPDRRFETSWIYVGARVRHLLRSGRGVVVHCKGGLGRTGLVAARLLVELGSDSDDAIETVRATRPGAIETTTQEGHVRATGRLLATRIDLDRQDRAVGIILAGAAGDALGAAVEFDSLERIRERFGPAGIHDYARCYGGLGRITDDTQMTLFTAEGVLEALAQAREPAAAELLARVDAAYRRWRMTQEAGPSSARGKSGLLGRPELWSQRAPGNTCLSALEQRRYGSPEHPLNDSKGCGGLMRVAPIGIVGSRFASPTLTFDLARRSAALTHGHPSGQYPCGVFAVLIQELCDGATLDAALTTAVDLLPEDAGTTETRALIDASRPFTVPDSLVPEVLQELGRGFVAEEALAIALACARAAPDVERALLAAVNHGGDSDSTGLLAGQIVAARDGAGALPPRLVEPLEMLDLLLETGRDLARASRWQATPERIDRLLAFLPFLRDPPEDLIEEMDAYTSYRDEVGEFEQILYRDGWMRPFDWPSFQKTAAALHADASLLGHADVETLRRLFVTHFRKERFCEGHLGEVIRDGSLAAILDRLAFLR